MVGYYKERLWRWVKTLFFLMSMLASLLLVCAPPLLVAILDILLPSALLSASYHPASPAPALPAHSQLKNFSFRASLVDVPIISAARSLLILCVYIICDGRGPYLGITTACSALSAGYVSVKAISMYGQRRLAVGDKEGSEVITMEALFLSSLALAVAHIVAAYRTSCRERRKLLVYRIDIEAVSTYHNDFPSYHKIGLSK